LVGYKGKQKVDWIAEKVGKKGEAAVRVATTVHLNQSKFVVVVVVKLYTALDWIKLHLVLGLGQTISWHRCT
jgi:hypothetical protein